MFKNNKICENLFFHTFCSWWFIYYCMDMYLWCIRRVSLKLFQRRVSVASVLRQCPFSEILNYILSKNIWLLHPWFFCCSQFFHFYRVCLVYNNEINIRTSLMLFMFLFSNCNTVYTYLYIGLFWCKYVLIWYILHHPLKIYVHISMCTYVLMDLIQLFNLFELK